jgi:hypothetical protein
VSFYRKFGPDDISIEPFQVHKQFSFSDVDSGSGVFGLEGLSGSVRGFDVATAASQSFYDYASGYAATIQTFYKIPTYYGVHHLFYRNNYNKSPEYGPQRYLADYYDVGGSKTNVVGSEHRIDNENLYYRLGNIYDNKRELYESVNIITVPQKFFGEEIKPNSFRLVDNSTDSSITIIDDGDGNLYDLAHSSSFANYKSASFDRAYLTADASGSQVGNIFYKHGIVAITETGSYRRVGLTNGDDGFSFSFRSTHTIYQHQYNCKVMPSDLNKTMNISVTEGYSGSISAATESITRYKYFAPGDEPGPGFRYGDTTHDGLGPAVYGSATYWQFLGGQSFSKQYNATDTFNNFVTHSDFAPYITNIGLYNDTNNLVALGKLARPIKNDLETPLNLVIRFDL